MQDIYRNTSVSATPMDNLCADVRQHVISFLGYNARAHVASYEDAEPGSAIKRNFRPLTTNWYMYSKVSEAKANFPWLTTFDNRSLQDRTDLISVQLLNHSWYDDFQKTVLECDAIMIHRAFQLRRQLKPFWTSVAKYTQSVETHLIKCRNLHRPVTDPVPQVPDHLTPLAIEEFVQDTVAPVSSAIGAIVRRTQGPYVAPPMTLASNCLCLIENFNQRAKTRLISLKRRELSYHLRNICNNSPTPPQCLIDALEPIALVFSDNKYALSSTWSETCRVLATPHYLLLEMHQRPTIDLLVQPLHRERILDIAAIHRQKDLSGQTYLSQELIFTASPVVGILYSWFLDLVTVCEDINSQGGANEVFDAKKCSAAVKQKRQLADNVATKIFHAEVSCLWNSDVAPLNAFTLLSEAEERCGRATISAQGWDEWSSLIRSIPSPPPAKPVLVAAQMKGSATTTASNRYAPIKPESAVPNFAAARRKTSIRR